MCSLGLLSVCHLLIQVNFNWTQLYISHSEPQRDAIWHMVRASYLNYIQPTLSEYVVIVVLYFILGLCVVHMLIVVVLVVAAKPEPVSPNMWVVVVLHQNAKASVNKREFYCEHKYTIASKLKPTNTLINDRDNYYEKNMNMYLCVECVNIYVAYCVRCSLLIYIFCMLYVI